MFWNVSQTNLRACSLLGGWGSAYRIVSNIQHVFTFLIQNFSKSKNFHYNFFCWECSETYPKQIWGHVHFVLGGPAYFIVSNIQYFIANYKKKIYNSTLFWSDSAVRFLNAHTSNYDTSQELWEFVRYNRLKNIELFFDYLGRPAWGRARRAYYHLGSSSCTKNLLPEITWSTAMQ